MAVSVYRWKIKKDGVEYYAYLLDENNGTDGSGFIYRQSNSKRCYGINSSTQQPVWTTSAVTEQIKETISINVSNLGSNYSTKFTTLNNLIGSVLGEEYKISGGWETYYNLDESACGGSGNGVCPNFSAESIMVSTPEEAGVDVTSGVTDGKEWYKLSFKIYAEKGEKGDTGERGPAGQKGDEGPQGEQGEPGAEGVPGQSGKGRNVMAFITFPKGTEIDPSDIQPKTNESAENGKYYYNRGDITYPIVNEIYRWGDNNECLGDSVNCDVWMTCGDFNTVEESSDVNAFVYASHWTTPLRINGEDGDNGADGTNIEFIYYCPAENDSDMMTAPDTPVSTGTGYPQVKYNGVPKENTYWKNHPEGITQKRKVEYMSLRTRELIEGTNTYTEWSLWSVPAIWARWGEDGIDGDGIEYIFAVTKTPDITAKREIMNKLPKSDGTGPHDLSSQWQRPEIWDYIRENGWEDDYSPWTDDPSDVSPSEPYEWVSIRRKKWDADEKKGVFDEEFSEPKIWSKWASSPITIDLTRESVGIGTDSDWVLNANETIITTDVYARGTDSQIVSFEVTAEGPIDDHISVTTAATTNSNEVRVTVTIIRIMDEYSDGYYDFTDNVGHSLNINITASAEAADGESITSDLVFTIYAVLGGKDGELIVLESSTPSIIHSLKDDTFLPSTISANVNCETCDPTNTFFCVGDWSEDESEWSDYVLGNEIELGRLGIGEEPTFIRFRAQIGDVVLYCDVPIIPTGKSVARGELSDTEFLIGTGGDDYLNDGPVSATSQMFMYYGNEKIDYQDFEITHIELYENGVKIAEDDNVTGGTLFTLESGGSIGITVAGNEGLNSKELTFEVGDETYLSDGYTITFLMEGHFHSINCISNVSYKIIGIKSGVDGHFYLLKIQPDEILCNPDKTNYFGTNDLVLTAFEVAGKSQTPRSEGVVTYTAYTENNASITVSGVNRLSFVGGSLVVDIKEDIVYRNSYTYKDAMRFDFRFYGSEEDITNNGLYDNKTVYVRTLAESAAIADFDDDTWIISTGEEDTILDIEESLTKTVRLNIRYGSLETTIEGDIDYEIRQNGEVIPDSDPNRSKIHVSYDVTDNRIITFTLDNGLNLATPFEIVFDVEAANPVFPTLPLNVYPVFKIAGIKNGKDGESYDIITTPSCIQKIKNGEYITRKILISVKNKGTLASDGTLFWYVCNESGATIQGFSGSSTTLQFQLDRFTGATEGKSVKLVYERDSDIWDEETIPILSDGLDGLNAVTGDFDDDTWIVSTGGDDILNTEGLTKTSKFNIYYGSLSASATAVTLQKITQDGVDVTSEVSAYISAQTATTSVTFTLQSGLTLTKPYEVHFNIAAVYSGVEFNVYPVFTIAGLRQGTDGESYDIITSPSVIQKDKDGIYITNSVNVTVLKNGSLAEGGTFYWYVCDKNGATIGSHSGTSTDTTFTINDYRNVGNAKSLKIEYRRGNENEELWDAETVPVVSDGLDIHQVVMKITPDDITCSPDRLTFYESAITVEAYEIVGSVSTRLRVGTVEAIGYNDSNGRLTGITKNFSTAAGGDSIEFNVNEVSNNHKETLHRIDLIYVKNYGDEDSLFDAKTVSVFPMAASLGEADFDDDTWYISTGTEDNTLDVDASKTSKLKVWYGGNEFNNAVITNVSVLKNGSSVPVTSTTTSITTSIGLSVEYSALSSVTFNLASGTVIDSAIEILFTVSGVVSSEVSFNDVIAKFTIAGLRQGVDGETYNLIAAPSAVFIKDDEYLPSSISIRVSHNRGGTFTESVSEGIIEYELLTSGWELPDESHADSFAVNPNQDGVTVWDDFTAFTDYKYIHLKYVLNDLIWDEETLEVLKDGEDAEYYYLDVNNNTITIDSSGNYSQTSVTITARHKFSGGVANYTGSWKVIYKVKDESGNVLSSSTVSRTAVATYTYSGFSRYTNARFVEFYLEINNIQWDYEKVEIKPYDGINPNILLRTNFDNEKGIDFVKEKWLSTIDPSYNNLWDNRIMISNERMFEGSKSVKIIHIASSTAITYQDFVQNVKERVEPDTWYTLSFYLYCSSRNDWQVFVFGGSGKPAISTSEYYVDGVRKSYWAIDGVVHGSAFTEDYTVRHTLTFKTADTSAFNNTNYVSLIFRVSNENTLYVCMPKLEKGRIATNYIQNPLDVKDGEEGPGLAPEYVMSLDNDRVEIKLAGDPIPEEIKVKVEKNYKNTKTICTHLGTLTVLKIYNDNTSEVWKTFNSPATETYVSLLSGSGSWDRVAQLKFLWTDGTNSAESRVVSVSHVSTGRMLYSAGVWKEKTYSQTETTTPFVYYEDSVDTAETGYYYLAVSEANSTDVPSTSSTVWVKMTEFDTVLADTVIANMAKLGDAVFYEEFIFSKQGKERSTEGDIQDGISTNYQDFLKIYNNRDSIISESSRTVYDIIKQSAFIPNYFVNFKNGESYTSKAYGSLRSLYYNINSYSTYKGLYVDSFTIPATSNYESYTINVPTGIENIGRVIRFTNTHKGVDFTNCKVTLQFNAAGDSGLYFYENGVGFSKIIISNEHIELVGFGDSGTNGGSPEFYGWIVSSRSDIMTNAKYGAGFKYMLEGKINVSSSGDPTFNNCLGFDGRRSDTTDDGFSYRTSDASTAKAYDVQLDSTGTELSGGYASFKLYFPNRWFNQNTNMPSIFFTPIGTSLSPYINSIGADYVEICAAKNKSFYFVVHNSQNLYSQSYASSILFTFEPYNLQLDNNGAILIPSGQTDLTFIYEGVSNISYKYQIGSGSLNNGTASSSGSNISILRFPASNVFTIRTGIIKVYSNGQEFRTYDFKQSPLRTNLTVTPGGWLIPATMNTAASQTVIVQSSTRRPIARETNPGLQVVAIDAIEGLFSNNGDTIKVELTSEQPSEDYSMQFSLTCWGSWVYYTVTPKVRFTIPSVYDGDGEADVSVTVRGHTGVTCLYLIKRSVNIPHTEEYSGTIKSLSVNGGLEYYIETGTASGHTFDKYDTYDNSDLIVRFNGLNSADLEIITCDDFEGDPVPENSINWITFTERSGSSWSNPTSGGSRYYSRKYILEVQQNNGEDRTGHILLKDRRRNEILDSISVSQVGVISSRFNLYFQVSGDSTWYSYRDEINNPNFDLAGVIRTPNSSEKYEENFYFGKKHSLTGQSPITYIVARLETATEETGSIYFGGFGNKMWDTTPNAEYKEMINNYYSYGAATNTSDTPFITVGSHTKEVMPMSRNISGVTYNYYVYPYNVLNSVKNWRLTNNTWKGVVDTFENLPQTGNEEGDTYSVKAAHYDSTEDVTRPAGSMYGWDNNYSEWYFIGDGRSSNSTPNRRVDIFKENLPSRLQGGTGQYVFIDRSSTASITLTDSTVNNYNITSINIWMEFDSN